MRNFIILSCLLHAAIAAPQLITFKDGKVGVNFLGYHAEAGLGGGQNSQNGLLGGLHASAGTPWGQNAAAGLGGNVNGRAAGTLYAGAQATPDVGASAVLGGDTSKGGYGAAESYVPGKVNSRTHTVDFANRHRDHKEQHEENHDVVAADIPPATEGSNNVIQKVKPHKKYRGDQTYPIKSIQEAYDYVQLYVNKGENKTKNMVKIPEENAIATTINSSPSSITTEGVLQLHSHITPSSEHHSSSTIPPSSSPLTFSIGHNEAFVKDGRKMLNIVGGDATTAQLLHKSSLSSQRTEAIALPLSFKSTLPSLSSTTPLAPLPVSLPASYSLTHLNEDNYNGNFNDKSTVIVRQHSKTRQRQHSPQPRHRPIVVVHRHFHGPRQRKIQQRLLLNQDHQRTKTVVRTSGEAIKTAADQESIGGNHEMLSAGQQLTQSNHPLPSQQHIRKSVEKRQLIAPGSLNGDSHSADENSDVPAGRIVNSALQIPIGILQSLQQSFARFP